MFQNIIVWQYPSYPDAIGVPQERRYCLMKQLETREDQDNNDVVVGAGHEARTGTWQQRRRSYDKIWSIVPAIKQAWKRRFWALFIILTLKCCQVTLLDNYRASKLLLYSLGGLLPEGSA